ncbi:hypothetical protein V6N13_042941 [Hibiscus sabdariffa]
MFVLTFTRTLGMVLSCLLADSLLKNLGPMVQFVSGQNVVAMESPLVANMVSSDGVWKWELFQHLLPPHVQLHVVAVTPPLQTFPAANVAWSGELSGRFSIKSTYRICTRDANDNQSLPWATIHKFKGLPKIRIFLWLFGHVLLLVIGTRCIGHSDGLLWGRDGLRSTLMALVRPMMALCLVEVWPGITLVSSDLALQILSAFARCLKWNFGGVKWTFDGVGSRDSPSHH